MIKEISIFLIIYDNKPQPVIEAAAYCVLSGLCFLASVS